MVLGETGTSYQAGEGWTQLQGEGGSYLDLEVPCNGELAEVKLWWGFEEDEVIESPPSVVVDFTEGHAITAVLRDGTSIRRTRNRRIRRAFASRRLDKMYILTMPYRYSIANARASLSEIIDRVEAGEAVELTRRGRSVAVVISPGAFERLQAGRPSFGDAYRAFLERFSLAEVGVVDELFTKARDRSPGRKVRRSVARPSRP